MSTPDTTEAVAKVLFDQDRVSYGRLPSDNVDLADVTTFYFDSAIRAIEADRKALAEQGYVIVKPVQISRQTKTALIPHHMGTSEGYGWQTGWNQLLDHLVELGLPIEITEGDE